MEVFRDLDSIPRRIDSVITVGTFDGVHLGHQFIVDQLIADARTLAMDSTIVTFFPHPKHVLKAAGSDALRLLTTMDEKLELFSKLGVERVVVVDFTAELSRMSSAGFVRDILHDKIGFRNILVGYDHGFGKDREGGLTTLQSMSGDLDFEVRELPEFRNPEFEISSTVVRDLLASGNVVAAAAGLGRRYRLFGQVVSGNGKGKQLGCPTANVLLNDKLKLVPAHGVYAVLVTVDGQQKKGMMNIGTRPTFGQSGLSLEVHIFDFESDIYGQELTIDFVERVRDEERFESAASLVEQLARDKENIVQILNQ